VAPLSMTVEELDELGRKLNAAELTEKEREVVARLFHIAAGSLGDEEVSGFSWSLGAQVPLSSMFQNSYTSGPSEGTDTPGGPGVHNEIITDVF
jgi:hypothetical protein